MQEGECIRILQEAAEMGSKEVAFSGGEPFAWQPLPRAIEIAKNNGLRVLVYTSGNIPKASQMISSIKQAGADVCIFSIFGANREKHEAITGSKDSFVNTREAISAANRVNLETQLHFVPLSFNYDQLRYIALLSKEFSIKSISVLRFVPQGRGSSLQHALLSKPQNLELKNAIEQLRREGFTIRTGAPYNFLMTNPHPQCCAAINRLTVDPNMLIYPCDAFKKLPAKHIAGTTAFSSLKKHSLMECWEKSPYLNTVRKFLITPFDEPCSSCEDLIKCFSGCLAQKVIAHGYLAKRPDPMCLKFAT